MTGRELAGFLAAYIALPPILLIWAGWTWSHAFLAVIATWAAYLLLRFVFRLVGAMLDELQKGD